MQPLEAKPRVFVGSSVEALDIAYAVQEELAYVAEVTVWSQGIFQLSSNTLDDLIKTLDTTDFGVFVFSPDDVLKIRDRQSLAVRDNVIFELGLFIGRLGKERSFFLIPRNQSELHLPTDLLGITPATFDAKRSDNNLRAAVGPASNQIRAMVKKLGVLNKNRIRNDDISKRNISPTSQIADQAKKDDRFYAAGNSEETAKQSKEILVKKRKKFQLILACFLFLLVSVLTSIAGSASLYYVGLYLLFLACIIYFITTWILISLTSHSTKANRIRVLIISILFLASSSLSYLGTNIFLSKFIFLGWIVLLLAIVLFIASSLSIVLIIEHPAEE